MTATDELRRENERLRQQVASIIGRSFRTADKMDCLERENAKLRELLRVAITYCVNGYCGKDDGCPLRLTDYDCQLLTKASELGVEVDG